MRYHAQCLIKAAVTGPKPHVRDLRELTACASTPFRVDKKLAKTSNGRPAADRVRE